MANGTGAEQSTYVLSEEATRWGIEIISNQPIHSFFTAYLIVRQQAAEQETDRVVPDWSALDAYLDVPGGPPDKPWYRPFWDQAKNAGQNWMRKHPAGSWNPSSVRPGTPGAQVLDIDGKAWVLSEGHHDRALEHLLHGNRVSLMALCAFLYRNYGFTTDTPPKPQEMFEVFRRDFGYRPDSDDEEFGTLYDLTVEPLDAGNWFEPWTDA